MTSATITLAGERDAAGLDRIGYWLLLAFVASLQLSIAAAGILLTATLACWAARLAHDRVRPSAPPFFVPLVAYAAVTLISAAFSTDPVASLVDSKQLLVFLAVPAAYDLARGRRAANVLDVIVTVGAVSAAFGIIQYGMLHYDSLGRRPEGAMSHYMTYSGLLMLVIGAAIARLVFGSRERVWPALVMPALLVALALTFTRSAWVGACAAAALVFILKDLRLTAVIPVVVALMFAIAPDTIVDRMVSMFDLNDPTNRDRLAMVNTGTAMIADHPLTGVGPNMVERNYAQYRDPGGVNATNPHLHNVPLQIAAERGLPALAVWAWLVVVMAAGLLRVFRSGGAPAGEKALAAAGIAGIGAMLAAGLFEYNFGDSEFLMLLLVLVTLPFAAARTDDAASAARS
ncbi:MAG: O-antigen ligase family protein [Vicinamibacterales bacterium]